ncbi:MAG: OmpH family outer membrane protein [Prevotella sp.]
MKLILLSFFALVSLSAAAQNEPSAVPAAHVMPVSAAPVPVRPTFGYLSYDSVLHVMPEYAVAEKQLDALKAKYDAEAKRVEDDFNKKYEEFLEGQRDFPQTILQKRQSELQELLDKNILFKEESRRLLKSAEQSIFAPLHARLASVLKAIGEERGYDFIINTDNHACPFINPEKGEDIGRLALERMK